MFLQCWLVLIYLHVHSPGQCSATLFLEIYLTEDFRSNHNAPHLTIKSLPIDIFSPAVPISYHCSVLSLFWFFFFFYCLMCGNSVVQSLNHQKKKKPANERNHGSVWSRPRPHLLIKSFGPNFCPRHLSHLLLWFGPNWNVVCFFLEKNNMYNVFQSWFSKHHSTEAAQATWAVSFCCGFSFVRFVRY